MPSGLGPPFGMPDGPVWDEWFRKLSKTVDLSNSVVGTLGVNHGGTGLTSYTIGDMLYASGATTLAALAAVATGNALISGGVATAPSWGKIGLTTHVSGTLGVTNGGTGLSAIDAGSILFASAADTFSFDDDNLYWDNVNKRLGIGLQGGAAGGAIHMKSSTAFHPQVVSEATSNDGNAGYWNARKTRAGGPVVAGDSLGTFIFQGADSGSTIRNAGYLTSLVSGVGAGWVANRFEFHTTNTSGTTAQRLRLNHNGNMILGTNTADTVKIHASLDNSNPNSMWYSATTDVFLGTSHNSTHLRLGTASATASDQPALVLIRSRGTMASPTIVSSGDAAGTVFFQAYTGSSRASVATIAAVIDGTPGGSDLPGRLVFSTTPDGSTTVAERWRINNLGYLGNTGADPTAYLELKAGTTTAGQLLLAASTLLTSPVAGMIERVTDKLHFTIDTGTARKEIALNDETLTSGNLAQVTTNGRLKNGPAASNVPLLNAANVFTTDQRVPGLTVDGSTNGGIAPIVAHTGSAYAVAHYFADYHQFRVGAGATSVFYVTTSGISTDGVTNTTTEYQVGSTKVVGSRITGWSSPTGTMSKATFNESTVTLPELAQRVAQLVTDLVSHGLIGA